jgi:hypothetical protein
VGGGQASRGFPKRRFRVFGSLLVVWAVLARNPLPNPLSPFWKWRVIRPKLSGANCLDRDFGPLGFTAAHGAFSSQAYGTRATDSLPRWAEVRSGRGNALEAAGLPG